MQKCAEEYTRNTKGRGARVKNRDPSFLFFFFPRPFSFINTSLPRTCNGYGIIISTLFTRRGRRRGSVFRESVITFAFTLPPPAAASRVIFIITGGASFYLAPPLLPSLLFYANTLLFPPLLLPSAWKQHTSSYAPI